MAMEAVARRRYYTPFEVRRAQQTVASVILNALAKWLGGVAGITAQRSTELLGVHTGRSV